MKIRYAIAFASIAAAVAGPASASLVLVAPENFQGTGLGDVNTVLTIQSPGSTSFEQGSVGRTTTSPTVDVIIGDAKTGASQTQTRSIASLGLTSAADLRVVFNAQEPGGAGNGITLGNLQLNIYNPTTGAALFSSGPFAPQSFADTQTGTGNSGFVFALDSTQAAQAQAAGFGSGANLIGLSASASDATGGPETFFVANTQAVSPVPEPATYALMIAGLGVLGLAAKRRRKG
jgi:hypothetical protein